MALTQPAAQGRFSMGGLKGLAAHGSVGVVSGVFNTGLMVSLASLIFLPHCPEYFAPALGFFLIGASVSAILVALLSSFPGVISTVQDVPAVICSLMAGSVAAAMAGASQEALYSNIYVAVGISTLATGAALLVMGFFKLGHLVRFLPHPVIGGFLAATGWLLVKGGLGVSTGVPVDLAHLLNFFQAVSLDQFFACLGLGMAFFLASRFFTNPLWVPGILLAGIAVFHAIAAMSGWTMTDMSAKGWLLGSLPKQPLFQSLVLPDLAMIQWPLMLEQAGNIGAIVLLNVISVLLYISGIEIIARRDLNINKDMRGTGISNILVGCLGAPSPFVTASETALAVRMQAATCWSGILTAAFLGAVFLLGGSFLEFFPKFAAGALLFFLGFAFLVEWVIDARKTLPFTDYLIVLGILLCVEFIGFLEAIGIGIAASVALFALRYSLVDPVRQQDTAATLRSAKDRSVALERLLDHYAGRMLAFRLQGFLFFGTANSVYERIKTVFRDDPKPWFVILDMRLVSGEDSSALRSFEKILLLLARHQADLVLCSAGEHMRSRFEAGGLSEKRFANLRWFPDLDQAAEWCEDAMIARAQSSMGDRANCAEQDTFFAWVAEDVERALKQQEFFEQVVERLGPYVEQVPLKRGDTLYSQGELHPNLYFVLRGMVSLNRDNGGSRTRVHSLGPWNLMGEQGFFLSMHAPFTAAADKESLVARLTPEAHARLEAEDPDLARELQKLVISLLGRRLASMNSRQENPAG